MPTTPELDAALLAAAQALPAHFGPADDLTVETLDAIQATTMSLPGGAFAVEAVVQGAEGLGTVVLIITGLVDHKNGEVFDRTEARSLWTAALTDGLTAMQGEMGEFKTGQAHMTDPFDVLENADEAGVAGIFHEQTLAALIIGQPSEPTGEGAAAELAAAIAAAEAELEPAQEAGGEGEDAEGAADADEQGGAEQEAEAGQDDAAAQGSEGSATDAAAGSAPASGQPGAFGDPAAGGYGQMPPGYEQFGGYPQGGYPPYGYAPPQQQMTPEEAAAAQARLQANMNLPGMQTPPLAPFMPGGGHMDMRRIDLLRDVIMGVSVELGRTRLSVQEILGLTPGSIVELDRAAGAPVDVLVNGTLIARAEVVVVDEEFAVRISEVVSPDHGGQGRASA